MVFFFCRGTYGKVSEIATQQANLYRRNSFLHLSTLTSTYNRASKVVKINSIIFVLFQLMRKISIEKLTLNEAFCMKFFIDKVKIIFKKTFPKIILNDICNYLNLRCK